MEVPLLKQANSLGCGPTALSMVLRYFGESASEEDILSKLGGVIEQDKTGQGGTLVVELALYSFSRGFKIYCDTYNIDMFRFSFAELSPVALMKELNLLNIDGSDRKKVRILNAYKTLLVKNADLSIRIPSLDRYKGFLDRGLPVLLTVNSRILFENDTIKPGLGHYIVFTGYKNDVFYYNDPYDGLAKQIVADKLIFALSNNITSSSAYCLVLEK
jgi:uncharacterized protein YvpB